jgi:hypothetical protein
MTAQNPLFLPQLEQTLPIRLLQYHFYYSSVSLQKKKTVLATD